MPLPYPFSTLPLDPQVLQGALGTEWQRYHILVIGACLARMQRYIERLQDPHLAESRRVELLQYLEVQTNYLNGLMRQVFAGGQAAARSASAAPELVSLPVLLRALVGEYQASSPSHRFKLELASLPTVAAGLAPYIQLVLEMLLDNALRCAPEGSAIEVAVCDEASAQWVFQVRDHGPGIEPELLSTVFDDPSRAAPAAIYGLGVSFARHLVGALGGRMWVESQLGQGATFSFSLPKQSLLRRWTVARPRVLVIDKDAQLSELLAAQFDEAGFDVQTARSVEEGLVLARRFDPQVVVLELQMGLVDCQVLFARLRQHTQAAVIFLAPVDDRAAVAEALWQGAADCLAKPFHARELVARTRAILRRCQAAAPAGGQPSSGVALRIPRSPKVNPLLQ